MALQNRNRVIWWLPLGRRPYGDTWQLQKALVDARRRRALPDLFMSVEHPHVLTVGRSTDPDNLLDRTPPDGGEPVPVIDIERGGDVTYHGPGQLVGYFVFDLNAAKRDLHRFLRNVEAVQLEILRACGLDGRRQPGNTGAWVGDRKIGSVGIAVRHWITYHGFALNASTDLRFFGLINPCGLDAAVMTSISELTGRTVTPEDCTRHVATALERVFQRPVVRVSEKRVAPALIG